MNRRDFLGCLGGLLAASAVPLKPELLPPLPAGAILIQPAGYSFVVQQIAMLNMGTKTIKPRLTFNDSFLLGNLEIPPGGPWAVYPSIYYQLDPKDTISLVGQPGARVVFHGIRFPIPAAGAPFAGDNLQYWSSWITI